MAPPASKQAHGCNDSISSDEEEWSNVVDAAERRRIQNRNAQRKYRRNLKRRVEALERQNSSSTLNSNSSLGSNAPICVSPSTSYPNGNFHTTQLPLSRPESQSNTSAVMRSPPYMPSQLPTPTNETGAKCHVCGSPVLSAQTGSSLSPFWQPQDSCIDMARWGTGTIMEELSLPDGLPRNFLPSSEPTEPVVKFSGGNFGLKERPPSRPQSSSERRESRTSAGRTMLHIAAEKGHETMVKFLLEQGADPDARDTNGWTPLHLAVEQGHRSVAARLLESGASLHATTEG